MMFMTPTPPIRSETKAMKTIASVIPLVMPWKLSIILSGVTMPKSSGLLKATCLRMRRIARALSMTTGT